MKKVLVEILDKQFVKSFNEIDDLEKKVQEAIIKIIIKKKTYVFRKIEIGNDLRRRYGLENVKIFSYVHKTKKLLSSNGSVFAERVEDSFVKRLDKQVELIKDIDADIDFKIKLNKEFVLKKNVLLDDLIVFYGLKNIFGIFEYDVFKKQILLVEDFDNPKG